MVQVIQTSALTQVRYRLSAKLRRAVKRCVRPVWLARLRHQNAHSQPPMTSPGGPVLSITTTAVRLPTVFYTLETIANGSLKPSSLVLWLDQGLIDKGLPASLVRQQSRGLEIRGCRDVGPHTKFFPQVMSEPAPSLPLVTADDDQLYPRQWLQTLQQAYLADDTALHCFRAYVIALTTDGHLQPYKRWPKCHSTEPSLLHFATGVSGIIYPPAMQLALRARGLGFLSCCPRADDIWLNAVALWEGFPVRQIEPVPVNFYEMPGSRAQGLARSNVDQGGNDPQLDATYRREDLARLRELTR